MTRGGRANRRPSLDRVDTWWQDHIPGYVRAHLARHHDLIRNFSGAIDPELQETDPANAIAIAGPVSVDALPDLSSLLDTPLDNGVAPAERSTLRRWGLEIVTDALLRELAANVRQHAAGAPNSLLVLRANPTLNSDGTPSHPFDVTLAQNGVLGAIDILVFDAGPGIMSTLGAAAPAPLPSDSRARAAAVVRWALTNPGASSRSKEARLEEIRTVLGDDASISLLPPTGLFFVHEACKLLNAWVGVFTDGTFCHADYLARPNGSLRFFHRGRRPREPRRARGVAVYIRVPLLQERQRRHISFRRDADIQDVEHLVDYGDSRDSTEDLSREAGLRPDLFGEPALRLLALRTRISRIPASVDSRFVVLHAVPLALSDDERRLTQYLLGVAAHQSHRIRIVPLVPATSTSLAVSIASNAQGWPAGLRPLLTICADRRVVLLDVPHAQGADTSVRVILERDCGAQPADSEPAALPLPAFFYRLLRGSDVTPGRQRAAPGRATLQPLLAIEDAVERWTKALGRGLAKLIEAHRCHEEGGWFLLPSGVFSTHYYDLRALVATERHASRALTLWCDLQVSTLRPGTKLLVCSQSLDLMPQLRGRPDVVVVDDVESEDSVSRAAAEAVGSDVAVITDVIVTGSTVTRLANSAVTGDRRVLFFALVVSDALPPWLQGMDIRCLLRVPFRTEERPNWLEPESSAPQYVYEVDPRSHFLVSGLALDHFPLQEALDGFLESGEIPVAVGHLVGPGHHVIHYVDTAALATRLIAPTVRILQEQVTQDGRAPFAVVAHLSDAPAMKALARALERAGVAPVVRELSREQLPSQIHAAFESRPVNRGAARWLLLDEVLATGRTARRMIRAATRLGAADTLFLGMMARSWRGERAEKTNGIVALSDLLLPAYDERDCPACARAATLRAILLFFGSTLQDTVRSQLATELTQLRKQPLGESRSGSLASTLSQVPLGAIRLRRELARSVGDTMARERLLWRMTNPNATRTDMEAALTALWPDFGEWCREKDYGVPLLRRPHWERLREIARMALSDGAHEILSHSMALWCSAALKHARAHVTELCEGTSEPQARSRVWIHVKAADVRNGGLFFDARVEAIAKLEAPSGVFEPARGPAYAARFFTDLLRRTGQRHTFLAAALGTLGLQSREDRDQQWRSVRGDLPGVLSDSRQTIQDVLDWLHFTRGLRLSHVNIAIHEALNRVEQAVTRLEHEQAPATEDSWEALAIHLRSLDLALGTGPRSLRTLLADSFGVDVTQVLGRAREAPLVRNALQRGGLGPIEWPEMPDRLDALGSALHLQPILQDLLMNFLHGKDTSIDGPATFAVELGEVTDYRTVTFRTRGREPKSVSVGRGTERARTYLWAMGGDLKREWDDGDFIERVLLIKLPENVLGRGR